MPIPDFVGDPRAYWLPPGTHPCTVQEIEDRLVHNSARKKVWRYFMFVLERVRDLGGRVDSILVNGSFVTARESPGDVDAVCLIPPDDLRRFAADPENWRALGFILTQPHQAKALFGVHLFFAQDQAQLEDLRTTFARGPGGSGLRPPDPHRDPPDLVVPAEKGILQVATAEFFDQGAS